MNKTTAACTLLALIYSVAYALMASNVISAPNLTTGDVTVAIASAAAAGYALGGLLMLVQRRWLWITGLVVNSMVIAMFFAMYSQNTEVMLSLPGLATKGSQLLLEGGLVYLIWTGHGLRAAAAR